MLPATRGRNGVDLGLSFLLVCASVLGEEFCSPQPSQVTRSAAQRIVTMKMRSMDGGVFGLITWVRIATGLALLFCAAGAEAGKAWNLRGPNRLGIELHGSYIDPKGELILVGTRGAVLRLKGPSEWSMDQWNPGWHRTGKALWSLWAKG